MPPVNPPCPGGIIAIRSGAAYSTRQAWLISQLISYLKTLSLSATRGPAWLGMVAPLRTGGSLLLEARRLRDFRCGAETKEFHQPSIVPLFAQRTVVCQRNSPTWTVTELHRNKAGIESITESPLAKESNRKESNGDR